MEHSENAVRRVFCCTRRCSQAETAVINLNRAVLNVFHLLSGDDYARIRAFYVRCVFRVLPDEAGCVRMSLKIEENQRFIGVRCNFFKVRVGAVFFYVVNSHKPRFFRVNDRKAAVVFSKTGMAKRHVIGYGLQFTTLRQREVFFFAGHDISP